jgi:hypothetical protein
MGNLGSVQVLDKVDDGCTRQNPLPLMAGAISVERPPEAHRAQTLSHPHLQALQLVWVRKFPT